jgi:hypothetical protein
MTKATNEITTNALTLTPERCEYVGADEVLVTLKTKAGDAVSYTLTAAALAQSVNPSVALINNFTAQVLRDLGAL